jgi:ferrous iron transport protein A
MSSTLNHAALRQWHRIAAHSAHHPRLLELGFLPLENVRVLQRSWFKKGALVVQVGDAVFGLRPDEASQIQIQATAEANSGVA